MPRIVLEKMCVWIIMLCTALIFFIPFVIIRETYFPYIFPKIIVFRVIVEIGLMAWIPLMVLDKAYRPAWSHPFVRTLSVFMGILVLTMLTGVDSYRSFWSTQERMTGVFTMMHFYVWFLMMISVFKTYKEWRMLLFSNILISVIVALYGFVQKGGDGRSFSYLGNALYLAVFAMMQIFFILFTICKDRKDKKQKKFIHLLLLLVLGIQMYAMFLSGSRTVFLSLIIGACMLCIPFFSFLVSKKKFTPIICIVVMAFLGGAFFVFVNVFPQGNTWIKQKLPFAVHRLFLLESYTNLGSRPEVWRMGIEGFKERPIFGWGWENFQYVFNKNYQRPTAGDGEKYFDRSHNQLIDILSLTGSIGFVSYLALWCVLFFLLIKKMFHEEDIWGKMAYAILSALFLGYFLQNLTVFDSPVSLILLYFSFGLAYFMVKKETQDFKQEKKKEKHVPLNVSPHVHMAGIAGVVVLSIIMNWGSLAPFSKSVQAMNGIAMIMNEGVSPEMLWYFKQSLKEKSFTNGEIRMELARDLFTVKKMTSDKDMQDAIRFAIGELEKSIQEQPLNVRSYFFLIDLYRLAGQYGADPSFAEKAEQAADKAFRLAPHRQEPYRSMPQVYVSKGDFQKAVEWAKKGLDYNISPQETHLNVGMIWLQAKEFDNAFSELSEAEKNGLFPADERNFLVYLAMNIPAGQENKNAVDYVDRMVQETHNDPIALGTQAVVYHNTGQKDRAQKMLTQLQSIDSGIAEQIKQYMK